jgi:hypothetical protein
MTKEEVESTNYFQQCDDRIDKTLSNYYYMFLQYWVIHNVNNWEIYDKFVFHFKDNELDRVELVKLGSIILCIEREAWLNSANDLDDRFASSTNSEYAEEFRHNEEKFCSKIIHHWSYIPLSDQEFVIGVIKESLYK